MDVNNTQSAARHAATSCRSRHYVASSATLVCLSQVTELLATAQQRCLFTEHSTAPAAAAVPSRPITFLPASFEEMTNDALGYRGSLNSAVCQFSPVLLYPDSFRLLLRGPIHAHESKFLGVSHYCHPRMCRGNVFGGICLSVSDVPTFESLHLLSSFFGLQVHRQNLQVKFVYRVAQKWHNFCTP